MDKKHKKRMDEMNVSSIELHGVSSLFEISSSSLNEETVNWETMGTFVPVAPKGKNSIMEKSLSPQDLTSESTFAHYVIKEKLGVGGMGLVYRAFDTKLKRDVALKVLFSKEKANETNIARFQQEAQAIAKLNHQNIVQLHEIGEVPQNYFAMEYVSGKTLKDLAKENYFTAKNTAETMKKIASAIDEAHKNGIIHRDLKPSNIMINKKGELKVLDFGIAKLTNSTQNISKTSDLLGTLQYMSPEQAQNEPIDFRTDVYSLGATLYELLTGRAPFQGDSQVSIYYQLLHNDVICPSKINPQIPVELATITLKCLEKKPYNRYRYASELVEDLENFLQNRPIMAKPATGFSSLLKFVERNKSFCGVMAGIACIIMVFFAAGYSMHEMKKEQDRDQIKMQQQAKNSENKIAVKNQQIKTIEKQRQRFIVKNVLLAQKINEHKQKIKALRGKIKLAKQQGQKKRVYKLNYDLINQISLKNELIKIAKLKKEPTDNSEDKNKKFTVIRSTENTLAKNKVTKEIITKEKTKNVLANRTSRRSKGSIPIPKPAPTPIPNPGEGNNGNTPNDPKKPEPKKPTALLASFGELKNTFPTAGKNKFPIKAEVLSSCLSNNGERFLLGYSDGNFVVGKTQNKKRHTLRHGSGVSALAIKGSLVLTGAEDGTVKIWDTSEIKTNIKPGKISNNADQIMAKVILNEHFDPVEYVIFDPAKNVFYTGSKSKPLRTWNVTTGELLENTFSMNPVSARSFIETKQQIHHMSYEFDFAKQELIVVTFFGKTLTIWRGNLNEEELSKEKSIRVSERSPVSSISICGRSNMVITGHENGKIQLRELNSFRVGALEKHDSAIRFISFSQDNNVIISASIDDVELWNYNK